MKQTGDEYPPSNLIDNLLAVLTIKQQNNQSNAQWYKKLNTRVDVAESVGVQFTNFTNLWDYCCQARGWNEYETLTMEEQETIRIDSNERLLAYLLIVNSSNTSVHESMKTNLQSTRGIHCKVRRISNDSERRDCTSQQIRWEEASTNRGKRRNGVCAERKGQKGWE